MLFADRRDAGRRLADSFERGVMFEDPIVVALPRGGVPVAFEIARRLSAPLDVFIVRKVGFPGQDEVAIGTVASGGTWVSNDDIIRSARLPDSLVEFLFEQEADELTRRERAYRNGRPPIDLGGRTVIVVDDGLASGATMRAALQAIRGKSPARVIVAVPVASPAAIAAIARLVDEIVCIASPEPFSSVGMWYGDFSPIPDAEVSELLARPVDRQIASTPRKCDTNHPADNAATSSSAPGSSKR